jgi:hypothetical protein
LPRLIRLFKRSRNSAQRLATDADMDENDYDDRLPMRPENLHQGMRLGPVYYIVSREQVDKYLRATTTGDSDFGFRSDNGEAIAPPTMRLQDYALLIATHLKGGKGGVHAKHWCEFHEPMHVGQAVKTEGTITSVEHKRGKFYFTLEYESRDAVTDQLLIRQAITSVLLNDKGEIE